MFDFDAQENNHFPGRTAINAHKPAQCTGVIRRFSRGRVGQVNPVREKRDIHLAMPPIDKQGLSYKRMYSGPTQGAAAEKMRKLQQSYAAALGGVGPRMARPGRTKRTYQHTGVNGWCALKAETAARKEQEQRLQRECEAWASAWKQSAAAWLEQYQARANEWLELASQERGEDFIRGINRHLQAYKDAVAQQASEALKTARSALGQALHRFIQAVQAELNEPEEEDLEP